MNGREVLIEHAGRRMPGYAALPRSAGRGMVVIHELLGRQPEVDRVVERLADAGFAAVEPDLFHGRGRLGCIRRALATISRGEGPMADKIFAARDWPCAEAGLAPERVGVIGFCLGGGLALATGPSFAAVSTNYGDLPPVEVLRGSPPVIGCYGGRDRVFGRNGARLEGRLATLGVECETHTFAEVGHSFLTDGDHPLASAATWPLFQIVWDPEVAEQGWEKILAFLDRHIEAA